MPLQSGIWTINIGGEVTQLNIRTDPQGFVAASMGGSGLAASWDEDSQRLILASSRGQLFVGYLFTDTVNLTGVSGTVVFTLVGSTESYQQAPLLGPQPSAKRSTFGWYAQIGVD